MRTTLLFALLLAGCPRAKDRPEASDGKVTLEQLLSHPVRHARFWQQQLSRPLEERIAPAPPEVIDYVLKDNAFNGYPDRPTSAKATPAFVADVRAAVQSLHPSVRALFEGSLVSIGLVDAFGASAYTEGVFGNDKTTMGGFVLLDVGALSRTANGWASWKENSPFSPTEGWRLDAHIETPEEDSRANAIRYILMHELGHVVDLARGINPFPGLPFDDPIGWPRLSWRKGHDGETITRFDGSLRDRPKLRYYAFNESTFPLARSAEIYAWLSTTSFPTLYAATSSADDLAETFASYAPVVLDKRPWEVTLRKGEGEPIRYWPCWGEPRCAAKEKVIAKLFNDPAVVAR